MKENKSIDKIFTRFIKITIGFSSLGDKIDNDQKVRTIIWALLKFWKVKANSLKELNDKEEMDFFGFIGNLKYTKWREKFETPKQKMYCIQGNTMYSRKR